MVLTGRGTNGADREGNKIMVLTGRGTTGADREGKGGMVQTKAQSTMTDNSDEDRRVRRLAAAHIHVQQKKCYQVLEPNSSNFSVLFETLQSFSFHTCCLKRSSLSVSTRVV